MVAARGSSQSFRVVAVGGEESRAGSRLLFSALDSYLRGVTATIRGVLVSQRQTKWTALFLNLLPGLFGQHLQSLLWYLFLRSSISRHY
jgi:hypothetical protein